MTWLAWRQFRTQAVAGLVLLSAVAITLAVTRSGLASSFQIALHCKGAQACDSARREFFAKDSLLRHLANSLAVAVPALIGVFWGAPLIARELENGSFRLAWTQSVTRSRWMLVKLGVVGAASMLTAGLFSLAVTWWSSMYDQLQDSPFQQYDSRGIVLIGYAAFAFALGVALGVILRRTVPAMAATFLVYFVVHITFSTWIRHCARRLHFWRHPRVSRWDPLMPLIGSCRPRCTRHQAAHLGSLVRAHSLRASASTLVLSSSRVRARATLRFRSPACAPATSRRPCSRRASPDSTSTRSSRTNPQAATGPFSGWNWGCSSS